MAKPGVVKPILDQLDVRPPNNVLHVWCDYAELHCLTNVDHRFSRGNLSELMQESAELAVGDDGSDEPEEEFGDEEELQIEPLEEQNLPAARNDRIEAKVTDVFNALAYRATIFGTAYPFELNGDTQEIYVLQGARTMAQKLYIQLLLSAALRFIPKARQKELTAPFEELSLKIFKCLMSKGWEVHPFGKGNGSRYTGHIYNKYVRLAEDVRADLKLTRAQFNDANSGDGGLDLVAWHPMGDRDRDGIPVAFAQCGCTSGDWGMKSLEASTSRVGAKLHMLHDWATYYFMPHDLAQSDGEKQAWRHRDSFSRVIMVDRLRIINLATQYGVLRVCLTANKPVAEAIKLRIA